MLRTESSAIYNLYLNAQIRIVFAFCSSLIILYYYAFNPPSIFAIGCDPFGYLRQASLFRALGPIKGLDTRIDDPDARFLIETAKSLSPSSESWGEAIAPHCHHYNEKTNAVILQYPPGTGFILSLFPKRASLQSAFTWGMSLAAACFVWATISSRGSWLATLATVAAMVATFAAMGVNDLTGSASIPVSIVLIPLCVFGVARAFPARSKPRPLIALLSGIACGALFAVRLPNFLLIVGLGVAALINSRNWSRNAALAAIGSATLGFAASGVVPIMASNWVNAGGPFETTYSHIDASAPIIGVFSFLERLQFYFTVASGAPFSIISVVFIIARYLYIQFTRVKNRVTGLNIGGIVSFSISIAFFCTHDIEVSYYMVPASMLLICCISFEWCGGTSPKISRSQGLALGFLSASPFMAASAVMAQHITKDAFELSLPVEVTSANSIVWADISGSTLFYYQHKYAAKLLFAPPCMQDRLVEKVSELGKDQYFIEDTPDMRAVIERLSGSFELTEAGHYQASESFPIYKLPAGSARRGASCE